MKKSLTNRPGFTLLEVLIALGISSILILGLTRLFSVTLNSYSLQDQLTEMNQNAKFVMQEVSDVLMQAGADCAAINSDTTDRDTILKPDSIPCHGFTIKVNPRGGLFIIPSLCTLSTSVKCSLAVDDASKFSHAKILEKIPYLTSPATDSISFYTLDTFDVNSNYIYFHATPGGPKDIFYDNDAVCSIARNHYWLNGTMLCLNNDTMAENIDSMSILFYNSAGTQLTLSTTPTLWAKVWSIKINVESKTSLADNRYTGYPDHCRRLKLTYQFRLKNKV
jgi:prepilin-type N-terminal cleavage/methylation domain-containing protein